MGLGGARQPGAPSLADASRMRANAETGAVSTTKRYQWVMPSNNASASNEFPYVAVPKDPYDDVANIKQQYASSTPSNWVVPFDQGDAQYMMRKRDAEEKAEFDAWVMQKYDITNPAENLMLQNIAPELFQRREEVIDANQALVSAYAKTRLRGAKSLADLELEWLVETNRLELPKGPIWNPREWRREQTGTSDEKEDTEWQASRYQFGLFSPLQWLTSANAGKTPGPNKADIMGSQRGYKPGSVPYPGPDWRNQWNPPYPAASMNTLGKSVNTVAYNRDKFAANIAKGTGKFRSTNRYASRKEAAAAAPAPAPEIPDYDIDFDE